MPGISRVKVWVSGEILTAGALNAEFDNLANNLLRPNAAETISSAWTFSNGVTLGTALPIASGGTGATSASAARTALDVPSKSGTETIDGVWTHSANTNMKFITVTQKIFFDEETELTDGANIGWNLNNGNIAKVTLGGNRTLNDPTSLHKATHILKVIQDGTGSRTLTYGTAYNFGDLGEPTLSTAANAVDFLFFYCDGTEMFFMGAVTGY